jgi:hypothetical protein
MAMAPASLRTGGVYITRLGTGSADIAHLRTGATNITRLGAGATGIAILIHHLATGSRCWTGTVTTCSHDKGHAQQSNKGKDSGTGNNFRYCIHGDSP